MASIVRIKNFFKGRQKGSSYKRLHYLNETPQHKLDEILLFSEGEHIFRLLPGLKNKKVLFLNDSQHKFIFNKLSSDHNNDFLLNYVYESQKDILIQHREGSFTVCGDIETLGIRKNYFDVVICPFVLKSPEFIFDFFKRIHPYMKNGSRAVFSIKHPHVDNMLLNQNPSTNSVSDTQVSRYFNQLKEQHRRKPSFMQKFALI